MAKKIKKKAGKKRIIKPIKDIQEKQVRTFILVMFFLLVFLFVIYAFIQATLKFNYAGLEFEKVKEGNLVLYRTATFPIFLREDPRKLKDISIDGKIILQRKTGIGGDKEVIEGCEDSTIAATSISVFLGRTGLEIFPVTGNKEEAKNLNMSYADCNLNSNYTSLFFVEGEENKIKKQGSCYLLEVANCEIMDVAERFIVASYAHSRGIYI